MKVYRLATVVANTTKSESTSNQPRRRSSRVSRRKGRPADVVRALAGVTSTRGKQRTLALFLGREGGLIATEALREACQENGAYNAPNFTQNMKKDKKFFAPILDEEGARVGWSLTDEGRRSAEALL